jgi:hypothetical protein
MKRWWKNVARGYVDEFSCHIGWDRVSNTHKIDVEVVSATTYINVN